MHRLRHLDLGGAGLDDGALWPHRAVGPDMEFSYIAQHASAHEVNGFAQAVFRGALVAHLGAEFFLFGQFTQDTSLFHCVGERFLHINMLAHTHSHGGGDSMRVIGSGNHHCIDALVEFFEHLAEIVELLGLGEPGGFAVQMVVVDVAEGDHIAGVASLVDIAGTLATHADTGDPDLLKWRLVGLCCAGKPASHPKAGAQHRAARHEFTPVYPSCHRTFLPILDQFLERNPQEHPCETALLPV